MNAGELTSADFDAVKWQEIASNASDLWDLGHDFYGRSEQAEAAGDVRAAAVFTALANACSLSLRLDTPDQPFQPRVRLLSGGSASLDHIERSVAAVLGAVSKTVSNPAVRSRLGDIAWVKARDHAAAADAVAAYLDLAALHTATDDWPAMVRPLERAFQIAAYLGRNHPAGARVRDVVRGLLDDSGRLGGGFRTAKLMELLLDYGGGNASELAQLAEQIAEEQIAAKSWDRARRYLGLAQSFWGRAKNTDARRAAIVRIADTFEAEANIVVERAGAGHLLAGGLLEKAIQTLRRAGGEGERVDRVHARLVEVQRGAPGELIPLTTSVDLTSVAAAAEKCVSGRPLQQALIAITSLPLIQSTEELRARVEQQTKEFLFMHLFPQQSVDTDGKTIGKQQPANADAAGRRETAVRTEMVSQAGLHWQIVAAGTIDPARRVIFREHDVRVYDFRDILACHPAVLAETEMLYAEGLHAGFAGDLPKAIHILIPQLENAFRTILEQQGVTVSSLDADGIQQELGIHALLYKSELTKTLGEDFVFVMQALLVDKFGPHLRHRMAHGLLSYDYCFSPYALAVWWLALRFAMLPAVVAMAREKTDDADLEDPPPRAEA